MKLQHIQFYRFLVLLVLLSTIVSGCSTKKNTWTRRAFHNVSAHYNGWWNGNESLKEGAIELEENSEDNYNKILPVYNYGDESMGSSMASYSDRAIEKGSMVAQRHTMWFKNREYCSWVPESYFLIGKAYFLKHEYQSARMTFDFIIKKYHYDEIQYESMLWLAKTFVEIENYQKAETYLELLSSKIGREDMERYVTHDVNAVYADLYIKQGSPELAIPFLKDAIFDIREKNLNTRMVFILAQIYQDQGNKQEATNLFKKVLKKNTDYKTTFNAKINLAKLYDSETSDSQDLVKSLKKMLKDSKNINYLDQVYYALAEVAVIDEEFGQALEYLRLSVAKSVENEFQKAVSSLTAADLFYKRENYQMSGAYYDTAMMFLPEDYPNYKSVKRQTAIISDLVNHLTVVQIEDSLQKLAAMPRPELNALVDSLIEIVVEEEERQREEELLRQQAIAMGAQNRSRNGPGGGVAVGGGWYFYNTQAMSMGYSEFLAKWGNRKLEDNWRLSNKQQTNFEMDDEMDEEVIADSLMIADSNYVAPSSNPKDRNYYLQNIPLTPEQMEASDEKISEALYNAGFIYKESLQKSPEAILTFSDFHSRNMEEHELSIQVYFQLYLLYKEIGNQERMEEYQAIIIESYPESDYAKLILNPEYFKELQKKHNYLTDLYEKTYKAYEKGQYTMVVYNSDQALEVQEEHEIIPKFLYLKAISMAKTDIVDSMTVNLEKLIEKYPNSEVRPLAENILTNLGLYDPNASLSPEELEAQEQMDAAMSMYEVRMDIPHHFVMIFNSAQMNMNAMKTRISDYNKKSHSLDNLNVSGLVFDGEWYMITISQFPNGLDAMVYYRDIITSSYVFPDAKQDQFKKMVISLDNYPKLYQDKDVEKYLKLFEKEYIK
ncbi:hypothetical protein HNS38_13160 [Lentimicrobium sp. L6]|uniref:type IX secretion system periplasmic lipoprotein PorW/SprE n=1 Tax=Lentimicrobium sp. L6 TaxID=2735916 RepID=UPI0015548FC6|nr:hypothetical protein [Lentimicrobium sp. L6]NPD85717.1 hypothetical protein [Lentimicrobium sp. L6]